MGRVPKVSSELQLRDRLGGVKVRWRIGRNEYKVDPGLYALGEPDAASPVLVSANYKLSFDTLRRALPGIHAWILVLDTDGVNVWCAAGKGTFGTDELLNRLGVSGLPVIVSHKNLIVPQLGAPGISAHKVKAMSGFRVVYGPIRASDIPEFLRAGMKATPEMRRQSFNLYERAVVIPVELVGALTHAAILAPLMFLSGGLGAGAFWENAFTNGLWGVYAVLLALLAGAAAGPLLLPWLPGRAFTTKGLFLGWLLAAILLCIRGISLTASGIAVAVAHLTGLPAITAFYLMNFTGSSTFTSLSGVRKEMRWAIPLEIAGATAGILAWLASRVL